MHNKIEGYEAIIKTYRTKNLSESEISFILKETRGVNISAATVGRFLKDVGFERMQRRSLKEKQKAMEAIKEIILDYKNEHRGDIGVPSKVHSRQLVKIQPEERLATTSELNPTPSLVTV